MASFFTDRRLCLNLYAPLPLQPYRHPFIYVYVYCWYSRTNH
jgi:hypothetical protein